MTIPRALLLLGLSFSLFVGQSVTCLAGDTLMSTKRIILPLTFSSILFLSLFLLAFTGKKPDTSKDNQPTACTLDPHPLHPHPMNDRAIWRNLKAIGHKLRVFGCPTIGDIHLKTRMKEIDKLIASSKTNQALKDRLALEKDLNQLLQDKYQLNPSNPCISETFYKGLIRTARAVHFHSDLKYSPEDIFALLYATLKNKEDWVNRAKAERDNKGARLTVQEKFCFGQPQQPDFIGLSEPATFYIDPNGNISIRYKSNYQAGGAAKVVTKRLVFTTTSDGVSYLNPRAVAEERAPPAFDQETSISQYLGLTQPSVSVSNPKKKYPPRLSKTEFTDEKGKTKTEFHTPMRSHDLAKDDLQLKLADLTDILAKLAADLNQKHKQGIVLNDVKPQNMVMGGYAQGDTTKKKAENIDFGLAQSLLDLESSRFREKGHSRTSDEGTMKFMPPERVGPERFLDQRQKKNQEFLRNPRNYIDLIQKSDVYSFGISLGEIVRTLEPQTEAWHQLGLDVVQTPFEICEAEGDCRRRLSGFHTEECRQCISQNAKELYQSQFDILTKNENQIYRNTPEYILLKIETAATYPVPRLRPTMAQIADWLRELDENRDQPDRLGRLEKKIRIKKPMPVFDDVPIDPAKGS